MLPSGFLQKTVIALIAIVSKPLHNPYKKFGISWLASKKLKHQSSGELRKQRFLNGEICFYDPAEFMYAVKEIFIDEIYNQPLPTHPRILDCGAHIGLSVIYLKNKYPTARIIAFEPDKKNFELLTKNLQSQNMTDVQTVPAAVWKENTKLQFSNEGSMSSKIEESPNDTTAEVKAVRLKDYLTENIDFLKMDIEGAEFQVLLDIKDDLPKIKNLFLEYHGTFSKTGELLQILNWLTQNHFTFYIQEAAKIFPQPFRRQLRNTNDYDIQLNIYAINDTLV